MLKKITESSHFDPLGRPATRWLFKVIGGIYGGRMVALFFDDNAHLQRAYADPPYTSWSAPSTKISDNADTPIDAVMDTAGNIHLAYTDDATGNLVFRTLAFTDGDWFGGNKITVYSGAAELNPSLAIALDGTLWLSWTHQDGASGYVHVKSSTDSGQTWGSGPSDPGDVLTGAAASTWSCLRTDAARIHVVTSRGQTQLEHRSRAITGGAWSDPFLIAAGTNFSAHFDVAAATDGSLCVAWIAGDLAFRRYDGQSWGSVITINSSPDLTCPQVMLRNNTPVVLYLRGFGTAGQFRALFTQYKGDTFTTPEPIDHRADFLDGVVLYNAVAQAYSDCTIAAASDTPGDVVHTHSARLLQNVGDIAYLGCEQRFRYLQFALSVAGVGGSVSCSYYDGVNWNAFTPLSGDTALDTANARLLLWNDYASTPPDWQKRTIDGRNLFWIRVEVTTAFTTGPVGSAITAIPPLTAVRFRRA